MSNDGVTFDLELAVKGFDQNLKKVDHSLNTFHKGFKTQAKSSSAAWASFAGNLGANAVAFAGRALMNLVGSIGDIGKQAIENAAIQEDAINDLNTALKGTGTFSEKASQDMQDFASSLQQTSIFGDEALLKTAALGAQMAKLSGEELKGATQAAADMASALGIGLDSAMTLIAKSATDGGSGLKRYGVEVEKGKNKTETLSNAIAALGEKFGGAALGKINTYQGAITQASNSYGDMLESVGQVITQSPIVISLVSEMGKFWTNLGTTISDNKVAIQKFVGEGLISLIDGMRALIPFINPVINTFKLLGSTFNVIQNGITSGIATLVGTVSQHWSNMIGIIKSGLSSLPDSMVPDGWVEGLDEAQETLTNIVSGSAEQITTDSEDIKASLTSIGDTLTTNVVGEEQLASLEERLLGFQKVILDSTDETALELAKRKKEADKKEAKEQKDKTKKNKTFFANNFLDLKDFEDRKTRYEELSDKQRSTNLKSTLGTIASLQSSSNKTLGAIGKAAAITTATIDGIAAVNKTFGSVPYPFSIPLAAAVGIATTANVAKIAGINFANGGLVPGNSIAGDSINANLNSREMVLNQPQQATLFNMANNGGGSSAGLIEAINNLGNRIQNMEIVLQADDQEIARSASRGFDSGIEIGRS